MSPAHGESKSGGSASARLLGSGVAGFSELVIFHPVDTVAKRLMSYEGRIVQPNVSATLSTLNTIIFKKNADAGLFKKWGSLFPGFGYGAGYKVLQRTYKFGGQPFVKDWITRNFKENFESAFGKRHGKTIMYATAGSIMGVGEIVLLPLDVLKIKAQTAPETLKGRGVLQIVKEEGLNLYKGGAWTAARNAPGESFFRLSVHVLIDIVCFSRFFRPIWRLGRLQRVYFRSGELRRCYLHAGLCCLDCWSCGQYCRSCASGCDQDSHPE